MEEIFSSLHWYLEPCSSSSHFSLELIRSPCLESVIIVLLTGAATVLLARRRAGPERAEIAGISLSHPDKPYFPESGVTKGEPALNVLPQTKLTGVGLGGAAYESEIVDSMTGQLIQCSMNASKGNMADIGGGLQEWGNARALLDKWIREGLERTAADKGIVLKK